VDDSVLGTLQGWSQLRDLDVRKTKITDAGIAELRKSNTRLRVDR
jgi:hypothetical protein